ncbi:hypothetical protein [Mycolicibacterium mageritense]|uniref:hypothetical protein n=1 Tax=Mycolicibacterium mageritense TaxID=53462 RepID=UPI001E61E0B1|nr:hypothetical protein [Mycolicibacterium mageritense]GJJ21100.1 hypothetical protein MTY414_47730 [Mycolicibacterium mageritense]
MREYPQFEDLGLDPAADHTEDLRPNKSVPDTPVRQHQAGTDPNTPLTTNKEF